MEVPVTAVAVTLQRIAPARHIPVAVQHEILLGVVAVGEIVLGGGQQHARLAAHAPSAVGETEILVESGVRRDTLDVFHSEAVGIGGSRIERYRAAESAARHPHRTGPVIERRTVYEVGGDVGKVHHAEQGRVHPHAVPCHARMRSTRAAKRHGSHRSPAVRLDEYRRAVGQHIGEGEGNVFMQERLIEHRLLNTDVGERPTGRHRHRIDGSAALLHLACRSAGGDGNSADDGCGEGGIFRTGRFRPTNRQQRQQACNPSSPFHSPSSPYYRQAAGPANLRFKGFRPGTSTLPWRALRYPHRPVCSRRSVP